MRDILADTLPEERRFAILAKLMTPQQEAERVNAYLEDRFVCSKCGAPQATELMWLVSGVVLCDACRTRLKDPVALLDPATHLIYAHKR